MLTVDQAMRRARANADVTVHQLSELSGIHKNTIYQYERGKGLLTLYNLMNLADALGMTLDEYVGHTPRAAKEVPPSWML